MDINDIVKRAQSLGLVYSILSINKYNISMSIMIKTTDNTYYLHLQEVKHKDNDSQFNFTYQESEKIILDELLIDEIEFELLLEKSINRILKKL